MTGIYVNFYVAKKYNLTAGIFSLENYYLFSMLMNKPYCKLHVYFLGILSSIFFIHICEYKHLLKNNHNVYYLKVKYPVISYLHRNKTKNNGSFLKQFIPFISILAGLIMMYECSFISFKNQMDVYGWNST